MYFALLGVKQFVSTNAYSKHKEEKHYLDE